MAKAKQSIRVLMADDHVIFRDGLRKLLDGEDDIAIVGGLPMETNVSAC
jgi:DNA-binding NarL/FixJ family response regulator